jgi:sulfur relay (sulfurtransferase) complex TusBCD TusD component (DsrE family)
METKSLVYVYPLLQFWKFQDSWKFGRPWLRYDSKLKLMFCDICVNSQIVNSFTTGCDIMKKECVTKVSLITLLELAELKPNADNLVNFRL